MLEDESEHTKIFGRKQQLGLSMQVFKGLGFVCSEIPGASLLPVNFRDSYSFFQSPESDVHVSGLTDLAFLGLNVYWVLNEGFSCLG